MATKEWRADGAGLRCWYCLIAASTIWKWWKVESSRSMALSECGDDVVGFGGVGYEVGDDACGFLDLLLRVHRIEQVVMVAGRWHRLKLVLVFVAMAC